MAEPDAPTPTPPAPPSLPPEILQFGGLPPLSLRQTLAGLFLFPHLVLISARRNAGLKRPLLLFLAVLMICTVFMAATLSPSALTQVGEFGDWLGRELGEVRRTEDGLAWKRAEDAPATIRFRNVRVDFPPKAEKINLEALVKSGDACGFWATPTRITFWTNRFGGTAKLVFDAASDKPRLNWTEIFPPGKTLTGTQIAEGIRSASRWVVPLAILFDSGGTMLLVCTLFLGVFTLVPVLLRGPAIAGGLRVALSINLYCSIVPLIVATAYSRVAPATLNFQMVFVFAFFGYLIWAFSRVRRFLAGV